MASVLAERAAYARYKQQLLASTAALGTALTALTFGLYSKVGKHAVSCITLPKLILP